MEMKVSPVVPADCQQFIHILRDDQSDFCFPLGTSLAGGADAWCVTYKFDKQTILPGSRLPEDGIVPFLLEAKPKKQIPIQLAAIPGKSYQACPSKETDPDTIFSARAASCCMGAICFLVFHSLSS